MAIDGVFMPLTTLNSGSPLPKEARHFGEAANVSVWFDGACPLCAREIAFFRRLDRKGAIHFEDISAAEPTCPIDRAALLARFHAQERGKDVVSGAAAFAAMWRAIPLLRPLGELARIPALLWVLERVYLAFLKVRPRLQRMFR
jgi:predicted DCC family thiol-disulfide oxidoreductase YuxK